MNILNLKIGDGFHFHKHYQGWNFPKVLIRDQKTFYVETIFVRKKTQENADGDFENHLQAYVWKITEK